MKDVTTKRTHSARLTPGVLILAAGAALTLSSVAVAAPQNAKVRSGQAQFTQSGNQTTITTSHKAIIEYSSFDIAGHETVQFVQPNVNSRVLNRIQGATPTRIDGALLANGQVFIVNPSGVIFGANSVVNVGTLFAGAGDLSNSDFLNGNFHFTDVSGEVITSGLIQANAVHLIGSRIANSGEIVAHDGVVSLLVGNDVMIRERGSSVSVRFNDVAGNLGAQGTAEIVNTGTVQAGRGSITLGAGDAVSLAIRNTGSMLAAGGEVNARAGSINVDQSQVSAVAGDFSATAMDDITMTDPINNMDGDITLDAGRDVIFETSDPFTLNMVEAEGLDFTAGRDIVDNTLFGTILLARSGNAVMTAQTGSIGFAKIGTGNTNARVILTQADDMFFRTSGSGGLLLNPLGQRLEINITGAGTGQGNLTMGGNFGGTGGDPQYVGELVATAVKDINVWDSIITNETVGPMSGLNGPIALMAGGNINFGIPDDAPFVGGPTFDLSLTGSQVDLVAQDFILDNVVFGTGLNATVGDVNTTATTGRVEFGVASVPANNFVRITQAQTRFVGANNGFLATPETTNLEVRITSGDLIFGGDFGGSTGEQTILSVRGEASSDILVEDNLDLLTFGRFFAQDNIDVDGFVRTDSELTMHAAQDGSGMLRFLSPGLDIAGTRIELISGTPNSTSGSGMIDALSFAPSIYGSGQEMGFQSTSPDVFLFRQDAAIGDVNLPNSGQFGGTPDGVRYTVESFGGDIVLDDGSKLMGSRLTLSSASGLVPSNGSRSIINSDLDVETLTVQGRSTLGADVTSETFQVYNGEVDLSTDSTLVAGTSVTFNDMVDAISAGEQGLSVATAGNTLVINADIGSVAPLAYLDVTGTATLNNALGTDPVLVRTVGDQMWNGGVTLLNDARLVTTDASTIRFGSTLDGAHDLDLQTNLGFVRFADTVGGSERLGSLFINSAGDSGVRSVPDRATIIGETGLLVFADEFVMNQNEKLTALGDLTIDADSLATLGDLVSTGSIQVDSPLINLLRRVPSQLLTSAGVLVDDMGLDIIARDTIALNGNLVLAGDPFGPTPFFGTNTGGTLTTNLGDFDIVNLPDSFTLESGVMFGMEVLDQRVVLPATDVSLDSLIDQRAFPPEFEDTVTVRPFDLTILEIIGIDPATPTITVTGPGTANIYADIPATNPSGDVETVTASRITIQAANNVYTRYQSIFGPTDADRTAQVASAVQNSIRSYMSLEEAGTFDPQGYRAYAMAQPETEQLTNEMASLLASMRELGLNGRELEQTRNRLLAPVLQGVGGVSPAEYERSLLGEPESPEQFAINR